MIYQLSTSVSAGGSSDTPSRTPFPIVRGLIYKMECYLPPGSSGLLHLWVEDSGLSIFPSTPKETLFGDGIQIVFDELHWIQSPNDVLDVWAYNLDTAYEHTYVLRFGIVSAEDFVTGKVPFALIQQLTQTVDQLVNLQSTDRLSMATKLIEEQLRKEAQNGVSSE